MLRLRYSPLFTFTLCVFLGTIGTSQVEVAPLSCYPNYATIADMNEMAEESGGDLPFATWKAALDYATTNGLTEIDFVEGTYIAGSVGPGDTPSNWGGSPAEFDVPANMTVNGNGALISWAGLGTCGDAFAYITGNNAAIDGFTFVDGCGDQASTIGVQTAVSGWTISNCNFDGCDKNGHSAVEISGGAVGTVTGCSFYNHTFITGSAMDIEGSSTSVSITECIYSCNFRTTAGDSGGAVLITGGEANFTDCTFDGNETGDSAPGGAVSIRNGASDVSFNGCIFTCNEANTLTDQIGGAVHIEGNGVVVDVTDCTFTGNIAKLQGGAINCAGAVTTPVALSITNTTFDGNEVNTSVAKGGAVYLNNTNATLDGNLFTDNTSASNGFGGAVYVSSNQIGNTATYVFDNNTFTNNSAGSGSDCSGNDLFTQEHIAGENNDLEYLADGHQLSEGGGSLQFDNGDDCEDVGLWTVSAQGEAVNFGSYLRLDETPYTYAAQQEPNFDVTQKMYWTINMYTPSTISGDKWPAFALSSTSADLTTSEGYALVLKRNTASSGTRRLQFVSFTAGLDDVYNTATTTVLADIETLSGSSGSVAVKVVYNNGSWTFYSTSASGSSELDADSRGFNNCMSTLVVLGQPINSASDFVGAYFQTNSGTSSNYADFSNYYFRAGDETDGTGGTGSGVTATCGACLTTIDPVTNCEDQGSIAGSLWDDGDASTADGQQDATPIVGATVSLYTAAGVLVATVVTNSDGGYFFGGLADGDYYVQFTMPSGYLGITYQDTGASETDSDVNSSLQSPTVTVTTSANNVSNSTATEGADGTASAAHYTNIDAGFTSVVLPVQLASFEVEARDCKALLEWVTESEINNDRFEIDRAKDGTAFETIGTVRGNGNSRTRVRYSYSDADIQGHSTYIYRLRQVDTDGRYAYSELRHLSNTGCGEQTDLIRVYPTILYGGERLNVDGIKTGGAIDIKLLNTAGQVIYAADQQMVNQLSIPTSSLLGMNAGIYYMVIEQNNLVLKTQRLVRL